MATNPFGLDEEAIEGSFQERRRTLGGGNPNRGATGSFATGASRSFPALDPALVGLPPTTAQVNGQSLPLREVESNVARGDFPTGGGTPAGFVQGGDPTPTPRPVPSLQPSLSFKTAGAPVRTLGAEEGVRAPKSRSVIDYLNEASRTLGGEDPGSAAGLRLRNVQALAGAERGQDIREARLGTEAETRAEERRSTKFKDDTSRINALAGFKAAKGEGKNGKGVGFQLGKTIQPSVGGGSFSSLQEITLDGFSIGQIPIDELQGFNETTVTNLEARKQALEAEGKSFTEEDARKTLRETARFFSTPAVRPEV